MYHHAVRVATQLGTQSLTVRGDLNASACHTHSYQALLDSNPKSTPSMDHIFSGFATTVPSTCHASWLQTTKSPPLSVHERGLDPSTEFMEGGRGEMEGDACAARLPPATLLWRLDPTCWLQLAISSFSCLTPHHAAAALEKASILGM